MPALGRAVALAEHPDGAVGVGEQLDLDVPRPVDGALEDEPLVAERGAGGAARAGQCLAQVRLLCHELHPDPAAACRRLQQHRILHGPRGLREDLVPLIGAAVAGHHRHAGALGGGLRLGLVAEPAEHGGARPDEGHAGRGHGLREGGLLREESVAGMDEPGVTIAACRDHARDVQIGVPRGRGTDTDRAIGFAHERRLRVGVGVHGHRSQAHALRGAEDAARDLAAIRDEDGHHVSRLSPQRAALAEGWPVLLSVVVVGIPFGIVARQAGLSPAEILAMSLFVFAGASQFAMVQLFRDGVTWPLVVATVFLINLRHLLMAAALRPYFAHVPVARRLAAAYVLTDEAFAMAVGWVPPGRTEGAYYATVAVALDIL